MAEKYQFFDGKKFTRDDKTGYYLCSTGDENNVRKRMHVYVWEYFNGPISKGYHIHHIDGDKSNNDIQNLQMLSATEHERLHGKMLTENQRETLRKNMAKATVMAKEWHNSNEGHECKSAWRRKSGIDDITKICFKCGKEYIANKYQKTKYCPLCKNKKH